MTDMQALWEGLGVLLDSWLIALGVCLAWLGAFLPTLALELEAGLHRIALQMLPSRRKSQYVGNARVAMALALVLVGLCATAASFWPDQSPFVHLPLSAASTRELLWLGGALFLFIGALATLAGSLSLVGLSIFMVATLVGYVLAASSYLSSGRPLQVIGAALALFDAFDKLAGGSWIYRAGFLSAVTLAVLLLGRAARRHERPSSTIAPGAEVRAAAHILGAAGLASCVLVLAIGYMLQSGWAALFFHNEQVHWQQPLPAAIRTSEGVLVKDIEFGVLRHSRWLRQPEVVPSPLFHSSMPPQEAPAFALKIEPRNGLVRINVRVRRANAEHGNPAALTLDDYWYDGRSGVIVCIVPLWDHLQTSDLRRGLLDLDLIVTGTPVATARIALSAADLPPQIDRARSLPLVLAQ